MSDDSDSEFSDEGSLCDSPRASFLGTALAESEGTLLLFDWDDTLLPSTWLQQHGLQLGVEVPLKAQQSEDLRRVAASAAKTLQLAKNCGHDVIVVTNAERGWVELSCKQFLPWLLPALEGVKILSARAEFEWQGITSPSEWKYHAFEREIADFADRWASKGQVKNIISVGDAAYERSALLRAVGRLAGVQGKSIKFVERPTVPQLLEEHGLLGLCLQQIVLHDGSLDLCIEFS